MRVFCIESFNKEYKTAFHLKEKQKGRNKNIHISEMTNYQELKDEIIKNETNIENINNNSKTLDTETNNLKQKIDNQKLSKLNKNNYIITTEDKDTIDKYIKKTVDVLKFIFNNLISLVQDKLFTRDRNKYFEFAKDLL